MVSRGGRKSHPKVEALFRWLHVSVNGLWAARHQKSQSKSGGRRVLCSRRILSLEHPMVPYPQSPYLSVLPSKFKVSASGGGRSSHQSHLLACREKSGL